jgi:Prokaryotic Cytochrome C oxidase subunit IV
MNLIPPLAVWLYMIVTTVSEVVVFYAGPGTFTVDMAIGIIAMINSLVAALFFMNIRKEPPVVQYMMLAPLALIMVLILTMLFAFAS